MIDSSVIDYGDLVEELIALSLKRYDSGTGYAHACGMLSALLFSAHVRCSPKERIENEAVLKGLIEQNRVDTATHILENAVV